MPISGYNNCTLEVYANFSTTRVLDTADDLARAQNLTFEQNYPGGLYGSCSFTVVRDPSRSWPFKQGQRLVVRNGLAIAWEGAIISPGYISDQTTGGRIIQAYGFWGAGLLGATGLRKAWSDSRLGEVAWPARATSQYQQTVINRASGILMTPQDGLRWNASDFASVQYTAPTGQTIKRIKFGYDFNKTASLPAHVVIYFQVAGTTYTNETALYDSDVTTGITVAGWITTDYMYIGMLQSDMDKIKTGDTVRYTVRMGTTKNAVVSTLSCEYWSLNAAAWTATTLTDGTAVGGKTLAQTGNISYVKPGDMGVTALGDTSHTSKVWIRLKVSANLTANINVNEFTLLHVQDWQIEVYNNQTAAAEAATIVNTNGTGTVDVNLGTPSQSIQLLLVSNVQQTPFGNGTIYGKFSTVTVYYETPSTTPTTVVTDWVSNVSNLNADTSQIASNTLGIVPWTTGNNVDYETAASNLARLAALGDASFNAWACYVLDSESTGTPSGKPVLAYQQQPALSDYDYAVSLGEDTLQSLALAQTPIYNDIIVSYVDTNGVTQWVTSADDAALTDTTSTGQYGTFQAVLQANTTSNAVAAGLGKRFLAQNKDVHFYVTGSIPVVGYILGKNGNPVPTSLIKAGKRLKVLNFLTDEVGVGGAGLTFIISHISYDDASETAMIDCGVPDNLSVLIARLAAFPNKALGAL